MEEMYPVNKWENEENVNEFKIYISDATTHDEYIKKCRDMLIKAADYLFRNTKKVPDKFEIYGQDLQLFANYLYKTFPGQFLNMKYTYAEVGEGGNKIIVKHGRGVKINSKDGVEPPTIKDSTNDGIVPGWPTSFPSAQTMSFSVEKELHPIVTIELIKI